ncbi:2Fe-2S iron-sulfur cluster-binding protein [Ancylobacter sp. WKF20]|uniref:(2Fe-2S)-binding protein n=1 Tax=Ancylobacter sp. WKF20 TaxID=3039801 RepID=UPI0024345D3A|nr:2Fe-2S iron-sulfur cluster-binding protein [Ancylobacter sp. WKF20]WGD29730.1 2Fe-2S iron-sulfur cluster-binding protein [Ancylobacter sp. WKF20]
MTDAILQLTVNGTTHRCVARPGDLLSTVLVRELGLTSVRPEPDSGAIGTSTVLLDGAPVLASLMLARQAKGRTITTAEGLHGEGGGEHPLRRSFHAHGVDTLDGAPGLLVAAAALLAANPRPTVEDVRRGLAGNLCGGTGYRHIVAAVQEAAGDIVNAREVQS